MSTVAAIALGSNLGAREEHLSRAFESLARLPESHFFAQSSLHESRAVGPGVQPDYLNAAALVATSLEPVALLASLLRIEILGGRDRSSVQRWGPRTIDLDLLLYGDRIVARPGLMVPHPRMHERRFVLEPLCEIAPEMPHPAMGRTVRELLEDLNRSE